MKPLSFQANYVCLLFPSRRGIATNFSPPSRSFSRQRHNAALRPAHRPPRAPQRRSRPRRADSAAAHPPVPPLRTAEPPPPLPVAPPGSARAAPPPPSPPHNMAAGAGAARCGGRRRARAEGAAGCSAWSSSLQGAAGAVAVPCEADRPSSENSAELRQLRPPEPNLQPALDGAPLGAVWSCRIHSAASLAGGACYIPKISVFLLRFCRVDNYISSPNTDFSSDSFFQVLNGPVHFVTPHAIHHHPIKSVTVPCFGHTAGHTPVCCISLVFKFKCLIAALVATWHCQLELT